MNKYSEVVNGIFEDTMQL